ncbi:MAG TPA: adenylate/guanylate cyclase domain-containing protein [Candidatus Limnocylindrales bacterium]|nr:adenylate/guanylate cyclase domain-containing protein [Candidatus Limnocylindrales bacterium]
MQFKPIQRTAALLAVAILLCVCVVRLLQLDFFDRLEGLTYDLRARTTLHFAAPVVTNLAFVAIQDSSIVAVQSGRLGYQYGLKWPRQVYGRLVEELSAEGAKAVAFDVQFGELRPDHPSVPMADHSFIESDDFFALQCRLAGNVILAATPDLVPPSLFATNVLALGDITTDKDSDGVLRRVKAFQSVRRWHPLIENAAQKYGISLSDLLVEKDRIVLPLEHGQTLEIPLDNNGEMDVKSRKVPAEPPAKAKPFTDERVWHMGIVLAAQELGLDLAHADVDLPDGRITLNGTNGLVRVIPVDANGYFYVDWRLKPNDPRLTSAPIENLLWQDKERLLGQTNGLSDAFRDKLVVVGSSAQGNDLTDRGATPLERDTLLVSKHWNVANSIITGRFIRRASMNAELALIVFLGALTAFLTWQLRVDMASTAVFLLVLAYVAAGFYVFVESRVWLPLVFPVAGILVEHLSLVTYRVAFEESEQRRVKSVFSKIVSPDVMNELLSAKKLSLGGARREVTVFFADIRGFTSMTDETQERVAEFLNKHQWDNATQEAYFDESAREMLNTVNLYLAVVADAVKKNGGTLDKYIGDCVMAFWGAPTPNEKHALACVRAAIDTQRAVHELNQKRLAETSKREAENRLRVSASLPPLPQLTALQLGTGINTGLVTVGLMGSEAHQYNYTVFGREVNLASRLENFSGSGRIIISDTTYKRLRRDDPALAATCISLPPEKVKGISTPVKIYEVPWQLPEAK